MAILSMATVPNRGYENPVAGFKATLNRGHYASLNNLSFRVPNPCTVMFASSHTRFIRRLPRNFRIVCTAASSAGGSSASNDENPYKVLGVSPIERFDVIKASYTKKYKDAEKRGDGAAMAQLERAYDKIMMAQLSNRKRGVTFGSIEVSKDIRYADKQPIVPWGPRYARPGKRDLQINLAISTLLAGWMIYAGSADWKPMEFLIFGYIYRIFQKLKGFEAPVKTLLSEDGEDESRGIRTGKRLLRTLALVFSCIAVSSVAYTGLLNVIEFAGFSIPSALINSQELFVTVSSAVTLFFMGSYYR